VQLGRFHLDAQLGAKGGAGLALLKDAKTKAWSPPVFLKTGEGSIGLQIGGQSIDSIFLIMNKEGVEMLLKTKFKIDPVEYNADETYELPVPGTFVVAPDGIIRSAFVDVDYTRRMEPADIVAELKKIKAV